MPGVVTPAARSPTRFARSAGYWCARRLPLTPCWLCPSSPRRRSARTPRSSNSRPSPSTNSNAGNTQSCSPGCSWAPRGARRSCSGAHASSCGAFSANYVRVADAPRPLRDPQNHRPRKVIATLLPASSPTKNNVNHVNHVTPPTSRGDATPPSERKSKPQRVHRPPRARRARRRTPPPKYCGGKKRLERAHLLRRQSQIQGTRGP